MKQENSQDKIDIYRQIVNRFPDDQHAPQALYMIGFIHANELGDTLKAQNALEDLIIQYPESNLIESARWLIDNLSGKAPAIEFIDEEDP
jgi:TolA-binding protein